MATGGTVTIQWSRVGSVDVSITGPGTFDIVDPEGAATFPETITDSTSFVTTADGTYTVEAVFLGRTVLSAELFLQGGCGAVLSAEPSLSELIDAVTPVTSTTTALEDIDAAVNTVGKYAGKVVFNTTTGVLLVADGGDVDSTWSTAAGAATHTPV